MSKVIKLLALLLVSVFIISACVVVTPQPAEPVQEEGVPAEAEAEEPVEAEAEEPTDVTILVGTYVLNVSYPWLMMPQALGYWEDMGYNVSVEPVGSSTDALQQVAGGNADMAQIGATVSMQAIAKEGIPIVVAHESELVDWSLAVPADSDIETIEDIKGKNVGVFSLTSSGIPLLQSYLRKNGLDPENDINMIVVGFGPQASEALNSGDADAVMLWGAAVAQLENLGHEFRRLRDEDWSRMPDFSVTVTEEFYEQNPQVVIDIVKGMNMALVFARENPECVVKLQWENWPDTKPADVDEETALAQDLHLLNAKFETAVNPAFELHGSELWGVADAEEFGLMLEFLKENGFIEETVDPSTVYINDPAYWEAVNDFDAEAIRKQAQACN